MKPTGFLVCDDCFDEESPQLQLGRFPVNDPQALRDPRPDRVVADSRALYGFGPVGNPSTMMHGLAGSVDIAIAPPDSLAQEDDDSISSTSTMTAIVLPFAGIFAVNPVRPIDPVQARQISFTISAAARMTTPALPFRGLPGSDPSRRIDPAQVRRVIFTR